MLLRAPTRRVCIGRACTQTAAVRRAFMKHIIRLEKWREATDVCEASGGHKAASHTNNIAHADTCATSNLPRTLIHGSLPIFLTSIRIYLKFICGDKHNYFINECVELIGIYSSM